MNTRKDKTEPAVPDPDDNRAPMERERPAAPPPKEIGGPKGPEPTRFGDWESGGRCSDF